jgi:putative spermidine/putrescine transport system permease protein
VVGLLVALPFAGLALQALADVWRAPALVPQEWGLRGFRVAFAEGAAGEALARSAAVAAAATAIALVLAWPAARVLGRRPLRRSWLVLTVLALPLLVPAYATGRGLAEWFIRLGLADSTAGLVLAHLTVVLPYVVLALAPAFGPRVREREEMADALGLGRVRRLVLVSVPAVLPDLAVAALLGMMVSWGQYGLSLAVGGGLPTLPGVLVPFVGTDPQVAAALALILLAPAVAAVVIALRLARAPA